MIAPFHRVFLTLACLALAGAAAAQQKPPAERAGMDPAARNKVASVMARSYLNEPGARATGVRSDSGAAGAKGGGCATNIGSPNAANGQGRIGNRYGAGNNDQVIVVKGPVVNVCK